MSGSGSQDKLLKKVSTFTGPSHVENDDEIFLKSIIPSRKATKHYLRGPYEEEKIEP